MKKSAVVAFLCCGYLFFNSSVYASSMKLMGASNVTTGVLITAISLLLVLLYYIFVWLKAGQDLNKGSISSLSLVPEGFSPGASRYLYRMGYDSKCFAVEIIHMAIKEVLIIKRVDKNIKLILINKNTEPLTKDEEDIKKSLFGDNSSIDFNLVDNETVEVAVNKLRENVSMKYGEAYFKSNLKFFLVGLLFSILPFIIGLALDGSLLGIPVLIGFTPWILGTFVLASKLLKNPSLLLSISIILFLIGDVFGALFLISQISLIMTVLLMCLVFMNIKFYTLLKRPTVLGRQIMNQLEGLKKFMLSHNGNLKNEADTAFSPNSFEKMLPYAMALDIEKDWIFRFNEFNKIKDGAEYLPVWIENISLSSSKGTDLILSLSNDLPEMIVSAMGTRNNSMSMP